MEHGTLPLFPNMFHVYPPQEQMGDYLSVLLQNFEWSQVAVISQEELKEVLLLFAK